MADKINYKLIWAGELFTVQHKHSSNMFLGTEGSLRKVPIVMGSYELAKNFLLENAQVATDWCVVLLLVSCKGEIAENGE